MMKINNLGKVLVFLLLLAFSLVGCQSKAMEVKIHPYERVEFYFKPERLGWENERIDWVLLSIKVRERGELDEVLLVQEEKDSFYKATLDLKKTTLTYFPGEVLEYNWEIFFKDQTRKELKGVLTTKKTSSPWARAQTEHLNLIYRPGGRVAKEIREVKRRYEEDYLYVCRRLKVTPGFKIDYYLLDSIHDHRLEYKFIAYAHIPNNSVYAYYLTPSTNYAKLASTHEMTHILSHHHWGSFHSEVSILMEALADWVLEERLLKAGLPTLGSLIRVGIKEGCLQLLPLEKLFKESYQHDNFNDIQAVSFIEFVVESFGIEKLKTFYLSANPQEAFGRDLKRLEEDWRVWLDQQPEVSYSLKEYDEFLKWRTRKLEGAGINLSMPDWSTIWNFTDEEVLIFSLSMREVNFLVRKGDFEKARERVQDMLKRLSRESSEG